MNTFLRLLGFLRPYRGGVIVSLVLAALAMGGTVALPWLIGQAIDEIRDGDSSGLQTLGLAMFAVGVLRLAFSVARRLVAGRVSLGVEQDLRNRFAMVKGAWEDHLRGVPFPQLGEGTAEQKIERLELALVDEMRARADPERVEQVADAMWSLVHARPDDDPVKQRVTEHHEALARLGRRPF